MPAAGLDAWHAWQIARYPRQRSLRRPSLRLFPTRARAATKKRLFQGWPQSHLYLCQEGLYRLLLLLALLLPLPLALPLLLDVGQLSPSGKGWAWK